MIARPGILVELTYKKGGLEGPRGSDRPEEADAVQNSPGI